MQVARIVFIRFLMILGVAVLSVSTASCGLKKPDGTVSVPGNPTNVPTAPAPANASGAALAEGVTRTLFATLGSGSAFEQELAQLNFYAPDNCMQLVDLRYKGAIIGKFVELSPVPCPGSGTVQDSDVLKRLATVSKGGGKYSIQTDENGAAVELGTISAANGGYEVDALCTGEYTNEVCMLWIEGSLFSDVLIY